MTYYLLLCELEEIPIFFHRVVESGEPRDKRSGLSDNVRITWFQPQPRRTRSCTQEPRLAAIGHSQTIDGFALQPCNALTGFRTNWSCCSSPNKHPAMWFSRKPEGRSRGTEQEYQFLVGKHWRHDRVTEDTQSYPISEGT